MDETLPEWAGRSSDAPLILLRRLAESDDDKAETFTFAHPRLLRPDTLSLLRAAATSEPERAALAGLERFRRAIEANHRAYLFGVGPIERLWRHVYVGAIRVVDAEQLAMDPCIAGQLFNIYVSVLGWSLGQANERNTWNVLISEARVLYAAAQASPVEDRAECLSLAGNVYVECARVALCNEPDGRLYRRAVDVAQVVVEEGRSRSKEALARGLSLLGRLKLDPYTANMSPAGYWDQYELRFGRPQYRPTGDAPSTEDGLDMPGPADALREASEHLRAAVEIGAGLDQAMTSKALGAP